jgi:ABC-type sulfate/molybdate transport systems ATPase subunit
MRARVGFSIATAVDPDILLLDEVLQTGDNAFKKKSRRRIAEVLQTAKAVVMVTHDMSWITAFCTRAILLDKGQIVREGDPDEIADIHEEDTSRRKRQRRQAVKLVKHGQADLVDVRKARRDGTLGEIAVAAGIDVDGSQNADERLAAAVDVDEDQDDLRALKAAVAAERAAALARQGGGTSNDASRGAAGSDDPAVEAGDAAAEAGSDDLAVEAGDAAGKAGDAAVAARTGERAGKTGPPDETAVRGG